MRLSPSQTEQQLFSLAALEACAGERDTRYPHLTIEEVARSDPSASFLPTSPAPSPTVTHRTSAPRFPAAASASAAGKDLAGTGLSLGTPRSRAIVSIAIGVFMRPPRVAFTPMP